MSQNRIDPAAGNEVEYVCMILFSPKSIRNRNAIYKKISERSLITIKNTAIGNRCTLRGNQIENSLMAMQPFYFKISL
jgi:hypothetical protein